ncbi:Hypothetical Protein FCC1311_080302 [Hondaea fermentalgiana]|uniref:Uncharacterized protein n=1 Tax=Hondaea fermentalgiana TaxID=2315210 RepID=A0A2R5GME9_9STRA|nr:Hypothetical Protein FCC1311_080302 [Hondaea fermentalgiana]|eukprot:GBG31805.1 Hypothetical Protein FCC1311_080302 [Hondaea fermentalgiana]
MSDVPVAVLTQEDIERDAVVAGDEVSSTSRDSLAAQLPGVVAGSTYRCTRTDSIVKFVDSEGKVVVVLDVEKQVLSNANGLEAFKLRSHVVSNESDTSNETAKDSLLVAFEMNSQEEIYAKVVQISDDASPKFDLDIRINYRGYEYEGHYSGENSTHSLSHGLSISYEGKSVATIFLQDLPLQFWGAGMRVETQEAAINSWEERLQFMATRRFPILHAGCGRGRYNAGIPVHIFLGDHHCHG